jgi:16S rRNA (cytosine967-C5)-methyltransferase
MSPASNVKDDKRTKAARQFSSNPAVATGRPTARSVALEALLRLDAAPGTGGMPGTSGTPADEVLDRLFQERALEPRDRALAWELAYGVLRHRDLLDWHLGRLSNRRLEALPAAVRAALRLGAYQLLHLTRIPTSAAVNESVNLVKRDPSRHGREWSGYVNAVLRRLLRVPRPALPSRADDPIAALSLQYSCPRWLTERWIARFGASGAEQLCRQTLAVPPLTIRANTLKTTREHLAGALHAAGHRAEPTRVSPTGLVVDRIGSLTTLPVFKGGELYIEDEAAQLIPLLLDPQPGERVLDACAAPGGKATHVAALMQNQGEVIALDHSPRRLDVLEQNCRRLRVTNTIGLIADVRKDLSQASVVGTFDRILLDAPCSSLGVLRRHPEGKWYKRQEQLAQHHDTQLKMLKVVAKRLRPGGVLVYSTCSTEPDENEQVVLEFCRSQPGFQLEPAGSWLPAEAQRYVRHDGCLSTALNADGMDGFFAARLRRVSREPTDR